MKYFVVNSKNRLDYNESTHSFKIKLADTINITEGVQLKYCSIPFTEYLINDYSNILTIDDTNITLTKGNYNITDLLTHLNTKIQVSFANMTVTYNSSTLKMNFENDEDFTLNFSNYNTELNEILGFTKNEVYSSTSNVLESDKVINLQGPSTIYMYIPEIHQDVYTLSSKDIVNIGYTIPITCNREGIIEMNNLQGIDNFISLSSKFNYITIELYKEKNRTFDINCADILLVFTYV